MFLRNVLLKNVFCGKYLRSIHFVIWLHVKFAATGPMKAILPPSKVQKPIVSMDGSVIVQNLLDHNAAKRVEILIVMRKLMKNNHTHMPFRNLSRDAVFEILAHVLDDVRWEVRYQCLLLVAAIIQNSEDDIDSCMQLVMPKVIGNLGHENTNIRRAALQILHVHMKYTNNLQRFLRMFIQHGLESQEYVTRKGCIMSIGILFTSEFSNENLSPLVESLSKPFLHGDASLFYPIFLAMQKIGDLVGPVTFESYLQRLDEEVVNTYKRVLNKFYSNDSSMSSSSGSRSSFSGPNLNEPLYIKYEFGIFEPQILEKIKHDDWKFRVEGIELMKVVLKETPDVCERISDMDKFMLFLSSLLNDSNFKIVILTLSVYELLIDKFRKEIRRFLKTFVSPVCKQLGDPKLVVREHAIKVIHKLMHHVKPADVLNTLLDQKNHRNPRLREEIVNRVTAAVLTFPSYSIEFSVLCEAVAPFLIDPKRRVRLAALECFAVLAQAMGPTRLIPLVAAVDLIELNCDGEGLMSAVQARLARRILPKCTEDGSVTYAVTIPSSAGNQNRSVLSYGADVDWIMAASGSGNSSTPPSRCADVRTREPSASVPKPKVIKSKSDDLIQIIKSEEERFSNSDDETNFNILCKHPVDSATLRRKSSVYDIEHHGKNDISIYKSRKGSSHLGLNLLPNRLKFMDEGVKAKTVVPNGSRIPILARNTARKTVLEEAVSLNKYSLIRTSSAGSQNTSPSHPSSKSVLQNFCNAEESKLDMNKNQTNAAQRKISPGSALSNKPILVRSPSLSQLQSLPQVDYHSNSIASFERRSPSVQDMGNVASYFRTSPDGVIITQPAPIHLDNVDDINVIVLDDHYKLRSSPSPQSWPSAELFHHRTIENENSFKKQSPATSMPDVYSVRRNSHFSAPPSIHHNNNNNDSYTSPINNLDTTNISISKNTRDKMLKKQQEILKEAEERRIARERSQLEHKQLLEKRIFDERERQFRLQNYNNSQSSTEEEPPENQNDSGDTGTLDPGEEVFTETSSGLRFDVSSHSKPSTPPRKATPPPPRLPSPKKTTEVSENKVDSAKVFRSSSLKTTSGLRRISQLAQPNMRNATQMSKRNLAASSLALFDESQNNSTDYPHPEEAVKKALKALSTETWMGKIEGIQTISRLAQSHPEALLPQLHPIVLGLLAEVKNLRSSVSRSAILAIGELFSSLRRHMEQDLDLIASTLLSKSGETVGFIRDDIDKVMKLLVEFVTPNKAALSIIAGGANHRNGAVRKTTAQSLLLIVEKMGATRILTQAKDVTEKLIPVTAQFLMDCMPLTRYYGRRILQLLMTHPSFDKLLLKYVQPSTLRNINSVLDTVRKKGAGDMPKEGVSARTLKLDTRRTGLLNRTM